MPASVRPVYAFAERVGLKPRRHGRGSGVAHPVPLIAGGELLADLADESGSDAIGLQIGTSMRFEDLPLGRLAARSPTIASALSLAVRASERYCGGQKLWLSEADPGMIALHRRHARELVRGRRQANDFALQALIDLLRRGAGERWRPTDVCIEGTPVAREHAEQLSALARRATRFGAGEDRLVFPASVLAMALPATRAKPDCRPLADLDFDRSIRLSVEYLLEIGELSLPNLAATSGMSTRSLQRHLAESGESFARLAAEARFELAARLLRDPSVRVIDVSNRLDYSDAANFTRAFRHWAGVSPQVFRRANAARDESVPTHQAQA